MCRKRARMSAGSASSSESTTPFGVSTDQFIAGSYSIAFLLWINLAGKGQDSGNGNKNTGEMDTKGGGAGDQKKQGPRFPQILLSGFNQDPLDEGAMKPFECDPRYTSAT